MVSAAGTSGMGLGLGLRGRSLEFRAHSLLILVIPNITICVLRSAIFSGACLMSYCQSVCHTEPQFVAMATMQLYGRACDRGSTTTCNNLLSIRIRSPGTLAFLKLLPEG